MRHILLTLALCVFVVALVVLLIGLASTYTNEPAVVTGMVLGCISLLVLIPTAVLEFNALRLLNETVLEKLGNIAVALKKRQTLISDLREVVQAYDSHEGGVHVRVAEADAGAAALLKAQALLDQVLQQIVAIERRFPELKANENYRRLMAQLEKVDDTIEGRRLEYNECVRRYNTALGSLPVVFIAPVLKLHRAPYFTDEAALAF